MRFLYILSVLLLVTGCSETRQAFGFGRHTPDEFTVVKRAPLSLPPGYDLRPPEPGAERPQDTDVKIQAQKDLLGGAVQKKTTTGKSSSAEMLFLEKAGATDASGDVRQQLDRETAQLTQENDNFVNRLLDKGNLESTVDPMGEAKRLRDNKQSGAAPTEGDVPVMIQRKRGLLENVF